ncbi:MAG: type II secretion system F family protein [Hyphomonadaceae bacterium]|nr:type II secretion system F family protein [Hyphomonadaceae bacterium]
MLAGAAEVRAGLLRRRRFSQASETHASSRRASSFNASVADFLRQLGRRGESNDPTKLSVLRAQLTQAGFFAREAPAIYLGARAVTLAVATVGVLVSLPLFVRAGSVAVSWVTSLVILAAILGPGHVLRVRRKFREREYNDGFPDFLDLLVASVEAGLSIDAAVSRCTEELEEGSPHLTIHLRFLVLELRAGRVRSDAWSAFADRLGIEDARSLAVMLRQAEQMGTSLSVTLTAFSQDMRAKRMLLAEERALALPAKLTVPLILFIFPCLLGVLLLPAIVRLSDVFAK